MNTESLYGTVKIFEKALNKKILLSVSRYADTGSVVAQSTPMNKYLPTLFRITVPYEGVGLSSSYQDSYAILQHELAHIIFGSTSEVVTRFFDKADHAKLKELWNILEDDRVEDCLEKLYHGAYQDLQLLKPKFEVTSPCEECRNGKTPTMAHIIFSMRANKCMICTTPTDMCKAGNDARNMVLGGKSVKATLVALKSVEKYVKEEVSEPSKHQPFKLSIDDNINIDCNISDLHKPSDTPKSLEDLLDDSVKEFLDSLSSIKQSLDIGKKEDKVFGKICDNEAVFRHSREYRPDTRIKLLRKYFRDLKFREANAGADETGEILNIDAVIANKVEKNGEIFESIENVHGLEIIYLIDVSLSMSGSKLSIAKQSAIDMVELSRDLFDVKIFVFAGSNKDPTVSLVQEIQKNKISQVEVNEEFTNTHTHHGVQIASQRFQGTTSKRVLIIITDGMPCAVKVSEIIMDSLAKKAIEKTRKKGISVYTIIIGDSEKAERVQNIFGKPSTISRITNPNDIYRIMKDQTVKQLIKTIKGG